MKNLLGKPLIKKLLIALGVLIILILLVDNIFLPWYVSSSEAVVPDVVGLNEDEAITMIEDAGFDALIADTSYGVNLAEGKIFLQKPEAGKVVKEGRTIYLFLSGGVQNVYVPLLKGKNLIDAKFALERIGLKLGEVEEIASNYPKSMIFDQQFAEGTILKKGETVKVYVSAGRIEGTIVVPDLIGKSLMEARSVLADSTLKLGKINYQISTTLLPNTILDQYPAPGNKLNPGEVVDLFVTKQGQLEDRNEGFREN